MSKSNGKQDYKKGNHKGSNYDSGKGKRSQKNYPKRSGRGSDKAGDTECQNRGDEQLMLAGNGSTNDPEWYMSNSQFVLDVSRVPFTNVQGRNLETSWNTNYTPDGDTSAIPGIAVVRFMPVPGISETATSGLNLAANNLAQIIRSRLSTVNTSYEPADIAMCILGVDSIYTLYCHIARIFGLVNQYSMDNFYYPKAMIKALTGFNDQGIKALFEQYSLLRARFNNVVYKASQLYQPTTFTVTKRHATLCNNIYVDGNTGKSQFYAFAPQVVFKLNEKASNQGTALEPVSTEFNTMASMIKLLDDMVEEYRNSTSMNRMFADMRRAFGDENTYQLSYVDEMYMTPVVHDDYILYQIYNMTIPSPLDGDEIVDTTVTGPKQGSFWVYQNVDKNIAIFSPQISTAKGWHQDLAEFGSLDKYGDVYNFHTNTVDSALLLESSRLKFYYKRIDPEEVVGHYTFGALGTELLTRFSIYTLTDNQSVMYESVFNSIMNPADETPVYDLGAWSAFDWAPMLKFATPGEQMSSRHIVPLYDWDNYTKVGKDLQDQMNTNILLNMWYNPVSEI